MLHQFQNKLKGSMQSSPCCMPVFCLAYFSTQKMGHYIPLKWVFTFTAFYPRKQSFVSSWYLTIMIGAHVGVYTYVKCLQYNFVFMFVWWDFLL
jgi:hypothetical protein